MLCFGKTIMIISITLGFGILLGLLLPVAFVAGIEAIIIVVLGICCCIKRK